MSRSSSVRPIPAASRLVTLDLMLKTFMNSAEFTRMERKNWEAVARLVPGTTARECARRWEELLSSGPAALQGAEGLTAQGRPFSSQSQTQHLSKFVKSMLHDSNSGGKGVATLGSDRAGDRRTSGKVESGTTKTDITRKLSLYQRTVTSELMSESSHSLMAMSPPALSEAKKQSGKPNDESSVIVIHVCDEPKNLRRDFTCPRDLLVREMRYFADYLSSDSQHWGEVDISVHCDVNIFDWLMCYVKQGTMDDRGVQIQEPKIEPNIAVSLLVSSDFLKMDGLVERCISYIHDHVSQVVGVPSNMNCINNQLLNRLSKLFDHNEIEAFRDKRDRFKSKLYFKKLEELFDPSHSSSLSPSNASTLYRCIHCNKVITSELQWKLKCSPSSMTIDYRGQIQFNHSRDPAWDVNDYLIGLRSQGQTWRQIYWRIWSLINALHCVRCEQTFQCSDFSKCAYHPRCVAYDSPTSPTGIYPCCQTKILRFDSLRLGGEGCSFRDHEVLCGDSSLMKNESLAVNHPSVLDAVVRYRDLVCSKQSHIEFSSSGEVAVNVFRKDEEACSLPAPEEITQPAFSSHWSLTQGVSVTVGHSQDTENDEDTDSDMGQEDEEEGTVASSKLKHHGKTKRVVFHSREGSPSQRALSKSERKRSKIGAPCVTWDTSKSLRWNQDNQREMERKRMQDLMSRLTASRPFNKSAKPKSYAGGMFCKLEEKWRTRLLASKPTSGSQTRSVC